jgi:hypothetical protein
MKKLIAKKPPYFCSRCNEYAICGLENKSYPGLVVNVCQVHFIEMMGREPEAKEILQSVLPL